MKQNACVLIPARYASSRFPGKPLALIAGVPMIIRTARIAAQAVGAENVYVCTDDRRIESAVTAGGFKCVFEEFDAKTGTDRIAKASEYLNYEIYINLQGDEPLVNPNDIKKAIEMKAKHPNSVINAFKRLGNNDDVSSINIPKVVVAHDHRLLYGSRAVIPGYKGNITPEYKKQVCIYAFNWQDLRKFLEFGRTSKLEIAEDVEILRFLELGIEVLMFETFTDSYAVDEPADIQKIEKVLLSNEQP